MPAMATKVKICGVGDPASALAAVELGADYLGLNFFAGSPRHLSLARARAIAEAVRGRVVLVGVFVNATRAAIDEAVERVGLDLVQLSGDEPPAEVLPMAPRALKVFRSGALPGAAALAPYGDLWGLLLDAPHPTLYGGTGAAWEYPQGAIGAGGAESAAAAPRRVFLAGGLGPDNVRRAVAACRPYAVDVCSRVESAPGVKDREKMRRLFEEVRLAEIPASA